MKKRALLKLVDLLQADAKKKTGIQFDFSSWGLTRSPKKLLSCETTACAMGLAVISGEFADLQPNLAYLRAGSIRATYRGRAVSMIEAAQKVFGLTTTDAKSLFVHRDGLRFIRGANAERAVAKRIREFVAGAELRS